MTAQTDARTDPDAPEVVISYGLGRKYRVAFRLTDHGAAAPELIARYPGDADGVAPSVRPWETRPRDDLNGHVIDALAVLLRAYRPDTRPTDGAGRCTSCGRPDGAPHALDCDAPRRLSTATYDADHGHDDGSRAMWNER